MKIIKAPNPVPSLGYQIFLGGSIEMGKAQNWQDRLCEMLSDCDITFLNPRRDEWDSSWEQSINNEKFVEQVNWELSNLEDCDSIVFYFDPDTMSPITLLELGLFAMDKSVIVCCPDGYWRKGNVDIVCNRYGVKQVNTLEELAAHIRDEVNG